MRHLREWDVVRNWIGVAWLALICCMVDGGATLNAADTSGGMDPDAFLSAHCGDCHFGDAPEGGVRLDQLAPVSRDNLPEWERVVLALESGAMPPPDASAVESQEVRRFVRRVAERAGSKVAPASALRRLNRFEYANTVRDLLGTDVMIADLLPEDGEVQGFDHVAGGLGISSILMQRYLEAADVAFESTIRRIQPLPVETRRAVLMESKDNIASVEGKKGGVIAEAGAFVDFTPGWPPARIDAAHPIEDGVYRCRVAVWPHEPGANRTLAVAIFSGPLFGDGKRHFEGMFDVTGTAEEPRVIELTTFLQAGHTLHILPWVYPEHVTWRDKEEPRPGVAIAWAETEGPLDQAFPSTAQQRLFGTANTITLAEAEPIWMRHRRGVKRHVVESSAPEQDIPRIIRAFAKRAFRRPVKPQVVESFVDLALGRWRAGSTFEQAVRAGVTGVMCSPYFLMLNYESTVDEYALAERLSYFLWSSMPDAELTALAEAGRLSDPHVLHAQVDRMLTDPKFGRFVENFTDQWLDLREIEFTTPDQKLYPEYDELLLRSMLAETRTFFEVMIAEDLSVMNVVDSDFAMLNQRLASHYGVKGVRGHERFRRVELADDSVRGGILTQASVLKVTANGTQTSPVLRGAWVLDAILGQPAPPPPAGVPAIEPDIRGATTIREQLATHRDQVACAGCHRRIDPPGFALEEFDVIGGHRERYRLLEGKGKRVPKTVYYWGAEIDSSDSLPSGESFAEFRSYRECLKQDPERIARAMATKLLIYACGRPVSLAQRTSADEVVEATRESQFGIRSMIHAVVDSRLFRTP